MWAKEPALPPAPGTEEGAATPASTPEGEPARGPDGKFVKVEKAEPTPEGEEAEPQDAAPVAEGEEQAEEEQAAAPEGEEEQVEDGPEPIVVQLPGRHAHDPDVEIEVTDPEVAERLRQLRNAAMRGEEVRAERAKLEEAWGQVTDVEEAIQLDPLGFIRTQLPQDYAPRIALQLLADPAVYKAVAKDLSELLNPQTSRAKAAELREESYRTRELLAQARADRKAGESHAQEVRSAVAAMIPPEYDAEKAGAFLAGALTDLSEYATRHNLDRLDPEALPVLLAGRLAQAGINPVQASARMLEQRRSKPTSSSGPPPSGRPTRSTGSRATATPKGARTGDAFVKADARKRAAAQTPPAGAGTPKAPVAPPRGTLLKEAGQRARAFLRNQ